MIQGWLRESIRTVGLAWATFIHLLRGLWHLTKLKGRIVAIFGGSRVADDSPYVHAAEQIARRLSQKGNAIITGGVGTVDEFFEVLNLMKNKKMQCSAVVLFGSEYWNPLITWFEEYGMKEGLIVQEHRNFFVVTDDIEHALVVVSNGCLIE